MSGRPGTRAATTGEVVRPTEQPIRLIDENGAVVRGKRAAGFALPDPETLLALYRRMVVARRFEAQVTALTRQGRLATYPSALGQEACEIAAVSALGDEDWLFPTYRDTIALLTRGVSAQEILSFFRGDWHAGFDSHAHRIAPQSTPLATQALHAVGLAHAARLRQDPIVTMTYLGDGATSEGDAHEAFNFAAVWQTPTVFLIQNNGFAISTPVSRQTRAATLADKAVGYGMPGYHVDGNDVAAMYAVTRDAVDRARSGGGPTLIEGLTYRIEAHTMTVTDFLCANETPISRFVLLDHMDWMSSYHPAALIEEWEAIRERAAPRARILMRSAHAKPAYLDAIRIGPEREKLRDVFRFMDDIADALQPQDRVHTYAGFVIADVPA